MRILNVFSVALILGLAGCGIGDISIDVAPHEATVNANGQLHLSAHVGGAGNKTVLWTASSGTVDAAGLFTAPELAGVCYVTAASQADSRKTDTATITVIAPVAITPSTVSVPPNGTQSFAAVVTATGDTSVTWSIQEGAAGGTISAAGVYTAPATSGSFHVVATSVANPALSGIAIARVGV